MTTEFKPKFATQLASIINKAVTLKQSQPAVCELLSFAVVLLTHLGSANRAAMARSSDLMKALVLALTLSSDRSALHACLALSQLVLAGPDSADVSDAELQCTTTRAAQPRLTI